MNEYTHMSDRAVAGNPCELATIRALLKRAPGRRIRINGRRASILDKGGRTLATVAGETRADALTALSTQAPTTASKTPARSDQDAERARMRQRIRLAEAE